MPDRRRPDHVRTPTGVARSPQREGPGDAICQEEGIDIRAERPKVLTTDAVTASDEVITMGCGDAWPIFPGKRYEDWELEDPAGQGIESVRPIRDEIRRRIEVLLGELGVLRVG